MTLQNRIASKLLTSAAITATMALCGCSSLSNLMQGEKINYKSEGKAGPSLDVPPDLTQLTRETRYAVPGSAVSASSFQIGQSAQGVPVAATAVGDVRIERAGVGLRCRLDEVSRR